MIWENGKGITGAASAMIAALCIGGEPSVADPSPEGAWSWSYQTGAMTDGTASEALKLWQTDFVEHYLIGGLLSYDKQIGNSRFSYGFEVQANLHFGDQGFAEFVLPVSLRYHPENSWWDAFDSFGFGLGWSQYTELSELELSNYDGESREGLVYWYIEAEFAETKSGDNLFWRLHHRSNAFDLVEPNGGSNAFVVGWRRAF